ncbi:3517_t:CDS:2 [Gigaspora rosea]|nr:3517_t:CDS:2 [Gigaspora rosea]
MSLKKLDSSLSESSIISKTESLTSLNDKQKSKSSSFLSTSLCDDFIDLTAASSEASDLEIPEIDIDDLMQATDDEADIINTHNFFTKNLLNKSIRNCTGAKVCEFVPSELKEAQHSEVNADINFYKINQPVDIQTSKEAKTHA